MTTQQETRGSFAAQATKTDKRRAGRTGGTDTPLEIRTNDHAIDASLRAWVYERVGRQLGKFALQIERIQVRFDDPNSPRGGAECHCQIHVILSKLPPVVVEMRGETEREAFDLATRSAERAISRNLGKHGYSVGHGRHARPANSNGAAAAPERPVEADTAEASTPSEDSLFGKRMGHGHDRLLMLAERPEKLRRDLQVDTSEPGTSANDRKVGYGHTGKRNTKLNTTGMTRSLEDSTTDRPSRKSTRGGANHIKPDNPLTRRTKDAVRSPKSVAVRAAARGR